MLGSGSRFLLAATLALASSVALSSETRAEAGSALTAAVDPSQAQAASKPELPADIVPGEAVLLPVPADKPVLVLHAAANVERAIVYLPGLCGNVHAVEAWKEAAESAGTVIALLGDKPCGGGRFRWGKRLDVIEARIERALESVKLARGGLLDSAHPVLFGYSQGADRAEKLAALHAERYARVVLGGSPHEPLLSRLGDAHAVAVFGGELETFGLMQAGAEVLAAAGKPARFFLFPKAKHGDFGPDGNRVMGELLTWLLADDPG